MPGYYEYDDDEFYSSECCIGCCRAGDFGTHDSCGPCYCRRSFKPDYDRTVYTGWSLGQYYPGEDENAGSSAVVHEKPELLEKNSGSKEKMSEQGIKKSDKTSKDNEKPKAEKTSKSGKTPSKGTKQK